jgi:hypothetical protein
VRRQLVDKLVTRCEIFACVEINSTGQSTRIVCFPRVSKSEWNFALNIHICTWRFPVYILMPGFRDRSPKRNVFPGKNFADPTIKKSKIWLPNLKYKLKNKWVLLAKTFTKGYHSVVSHVLYHFCDTSLITDCAIFCSLKFHVVCTCTFFGDTFCLPTNRKMIKIVTLIDSHIVLTYDCWHCFSVSNI